MHLGTTASKTKGEGPHSPHLSGDTPASSFKSSVCVCLFVNMCCFTSFCVRFEHTPLNLLHVLLSLSWQQWRAKGQQGQACKQMHRLSSCCCRATFLCLLQSLTFCSSRGMNVLSSAAGRERCCLSLHTLSMPEWGTRFFPESDPPFSCKVAHSVTNPTDPSSASSAYSMLTCITSQHLHCWCQRDRKESHMPDSAGSQATSCLSRQPSRLEQRADSCIHEARVDGLLDVLAEGS